MPPSPPPVESDSDSALLDALDSDSDPSLAPYRAQRIQQLQDELRREKQLHNESDSANDIYGSYAEISDEKALMDIVTATCWCVVHFFKDGFKRCEVMDGHLETLAPSHLRTRFLRMNVENAPFLVTKLKIQVLPCVIAFVDGIGADRVVGFEGLEFGDEFKTVDLETRLINAGVLMMRAMTLKAVHSGKRTDDDDDGDDDWD